MKPEHLLNTAEKLIRGRNRPRQADLKRAISTAYYAVFHELAKASADFMVGTPGPNRSDGAWRQVYRALNHGQVIQQCQRKEFTKGSFPQAIKDFADEFKELQIKRHDADYNPVYRATKFDVQETIRLARQAIARFRAETPKDRSAFCVFVMLKMRAG